MAARKKIMTPIKSKDIGDEILDDRSPPLPLTTVKILFGGCPEKRRKINFLLRLNLLTQVDWRNMWGAKSISWLLSIQ